MDEKTITLSLNYNEAQVLLNLIDIACKASGLGAASACVHFQQRLEDAKKTPAVSPPPTSQAEIKS